MLYSKTAQYSIQSMLFIAANSSEQNILVRDVAQELGLPSSFLSKILQTLSRYGFLNSVKGPKGGFSLSEKGANSTIAELVAVVDGPMNFDMCLAGFTPCNEDNPCPFHYEWKRIREEIREMVNGRSIQDLAAEMPARYKVLLTGGLALEKKVPRETIATSAKPTSKTSTTSKTTSTASSKTASKAKTAEKK